MRVKVRAFAAIRDAVGFGEKIIEVVDGARVNEIVSFLVDAYPAAALGARRFSVAVNRKFAERDQTLREGDEVALIPPVSGG